MDHDALLRELKEQEERLQFTVFTNEMAVEIGMYLYQKAREEKLPVTIDVTRSGQQLFHAALPGTSPDNDQWIIRKCRVVNRFYQSSYRVGIQLKNEGRSLEEKFNISTLDFAPHGGCFPIILRGTGVIGTITVSGLEQSADHAMVVEAVEKFIK